MIMRGIVSLSALRGINWFAGPKNMLKAGAHVATKSRVFEEAPAQASVLYFNFSSVYETGLYPTTTLPVFVAYMLYKLLLKAKLGTCLWLES
jgi:hypothetical protein